VSANKRAMAAAIGCCALTVASCSGSTARVAVPRPTDGYPTVVSAALCSAGLRPMYVSAPRVHHADRNVNGYSLRYTRPAPGTDVKVGSVVDLTLVEDHNLGGPWLGQRGDQKLPKVTGLDVNTALRRLTTLGLRVNVTTTTPTGVLRVTQQVPGAGTVVPSGSTVTVLAGQRGSQACH
jgi:beta-lactam-binding protein with PASTA domain